MLRTPAITAALAAGDLAGAAWALCQHLSGLGVGNYLHPVEGELELANYHAGHPPGRYRLIIDYPGQGIRLAPIDRREAVFLCRGGNHGYSDTAKRHAPQRDLDQSL